MLGRMMDAPLLITEIMRFADRNFGDRQIVSVTCDQPRHRTTWSEIFRRARKLANALEAAGVKAGDRIGTIAWNDHRHLELYYAVSCMGAVLHTINPRLFPEQVEFIVNHAEDKLLFVDPTLLPIAAALEGKAPCVERTIVLGSVRDDAAGDRRQAPGLRIVHRRSPRDVRLASPRRTYGERAVLHLRHDRSSERRALQPPLDRAACIRWLSARHTGVVGQRLRAGRRADVPCQRMGPAVQRADDRREARLPGPANGDAATIVKLLNEERVTLAAAVPTVWTLLLNHLQQTGEKLETLQRCLIGVRPCHCR
jgi:fatty-acyl-CoA synthase